MMEHPEINVFIIDDDLDILNYYTIIFRMKGINVVGTATNGHEAILKLKNEILKPDYIIIDYHMPEIDGIEASRNILKIDKTFKIIMVSGDSSIKEKAFSSGIIDFYDKHHNVDKLCAKLRRLSTKDKQYNK